MSARLCAYVIVSVMGLENFEFRYGFRFGWCVWVYVWWLFVGLDGSGCESVSF